MAKTTDLTIEQLKAENDALKATVVKLAIVIASSGDVIIWGS